MPIRFQVDPDFYDHPKTLDLSDAATALWTRAGSYSTAKLLDGFVPEAVLVRLSKNPEEASGELVRRGLWRRVKGGFQFHQWGERNLTRARVESDRDYEREKKRRQRREAHPQVNGTSVPSGQDRDTSGTPPGVPPLSVSVSESVSVSGSGQAAPSARASPEPPRTCAKHRDDPDPPQCGVCADARRTHGQWELAEAERRRRAPKCRKHRGQPRDTCGLCRSEALGAE